jgi:Asp-tRNA(Asn)/Glu-tRNA(Gln) amidotransferase A subunit family amidase
MDGLSAVTAARLVNMIREKRLGVEEYTRACLERIQKFDGPEGLNTVAELDGRAVEQAKRMDAAKSGRDRAMFGLPVL